MAVKFFGQFLVDKKTISKLDLLRAIELQEKTNLRFGDLVVEMGLMTNEQIVLTHRSQRHEDLQFGDMAVKMGFLTPEQIQQVLDKQRKKHLYIGGALVKLEIITNENLEIYLRDFKQSQKVYVAEKIIIPAGVPHQPIGEIVADMTYKMLTRVAGVTFRTTPCTITKTLPVCQIIVEMELSGSISARYLLIISENTRNLIANTILKENKVKTGTTDEIDEAVKKFVNIVGGNIASKTAHLDYSIEITPAQIHRQKAAGRKILENQIALLFPIYFSNGESLELVLLIQKEHECH